MQKFIAIKKVSKKYNKIAEADVRAWKLPAEAVSQVVDVIYAKMGIFDRLKTAFVAEDVDLNKLESCSDFVCKVRMEHNCLAELSIYIPTSASEFSLDEL